MILDVLQPVAALALSEVLSQSPYLTAARVAKPAEVLMIPAEALRAKVRKDPQLAGAMIRLLSVQCRALVEQISNLKLRTTAERLVCYLLSLAPDAAVVADVTLPYEKRLVASHLGMTPESLSRAFAALHDLGVMLDGGMVRLNSVDRLRSYCSPGRLPSPPG